MDGWTGINQSGKGCMVRYSAIRRFLARRKRKEEHTYAREEYVQLGTLGGGLKGSRSGLRESMRREKRNGRKSCVCACVCMCVYEGGGGEATPTRSIRYASVVHQLFGNGDELGEGRMAPVGLGRSKMVLENIDM